MAAQFSEAPDLLIVLSLRQYNSSARDNAKLDPVARYNAQAFAYRLWNCDPSLGVYGRAHDKPQYMPRISVSSAARPAMSRLATRLAIAGRRGAIRAPTMAKN